MCDRECREVSYRAIMLRMLRSQRSVMIQADEDWGRVRCGIRK